jgi:hypothetical protein
MTNEVSEKIPKERRKMTPKQKELCRLFRGWLSNCTNPSRLSALAEEMVDYELRVRLKGKT